MAVALMPIARSTKIGRPTKAIEQARAAEQLRIIDEQLRAEIRAAKKAMWGTPKYRGGWPSLKGN